MRTDRLAGVAGDEQPVVLAQGNGQPALWVDDAVALAVHEPQRRVPVDVQEGELDVFAFERGFDGIQFPAAGALEQIDDETFKCLAVLPLITRDVVRDEPF